MSIPELMKIAHDLYHKDIGNSLKHTDTPKIIIEENEFVGDIDNDIPGYLVKMPHMGRIFIGPGKTLEEAMENLVIRLRSHKLIE